MSNESLIIKHRPTKLSQVVGQEQAVDSYRSALKNQTSHAFLFTGPSGTGKTTLARIGAYMLGARSSRDLQEVDAATYRGIDDMKNLTATLYLRPLGAVKAFIIDECHAITADAWKTLLKPVEEPPEWVYWFFCTTDIAKVPDAIKTRCSCYPLRQLTQAELIDYLESICEAENFDTSRQIVELCAKQANGSPRQALSNLAKCYESKSRQDAAHLIAELEVEEGGTPFLLAKAIYDGLSWTRIQEILTKLNEDKVNPETVRHIVLSYFTKVVLGAKNKDAACRALAVLDHFSEPFYTADGFSPVVIAVGRALFSRNV